MTMAPEIPLDIRELLHDSILALFWPKAKIVEFFKSVGCPDGILAAISPDDAGLSRHAMVVEAFSQLTARPDRGFSVFQTMIDRLVNWTYFDPYWFVTKAQLDRAAAEATLTRLRHAIGERNRTTQSRRQAAGASRKVQSKGADLGALTTAFAQVCGTSMSPQARGKLFEGFLRELFAHQSIQMSEQFRILGEEIDGTFKFEGENYIIEAKWQDPSVSTGQLYHFAMKVEGKMHGRGVFISVNGFSHEGIKSVVHGKLIKAILMDGEDLSYVLEGRITLEKMLDYKIRAAQTRGEVYVCAIRDTEKL